MVTKIESGPFAGRPTTLGGKLIEDARQSLANQSLANQGQGGGTAGSSTSSAGASAGGRVVTDSVDFATATLDGQKVVNLAVGSQTASDVRNAKPEDLPSALDRGLAQGSHVGNLFRAVLRGLAGFFSFGR